jgi:hypothetical protein
VICDDRFREARYREGRVIYLPAALVAFTLFSRPFTFPIYQVLPPPPNGCVFGNPPLPCEMFNLDAGPEPSLLQDKLIGGEHLEVR